MSGWAVFIDDYGMLLVLGYLAWWHCRKQILRLDRSLRAHLAVIDEVERAMRATQATDPTRAAQLADAINAVHELREATEAEVPVQRLPWYRRFLRSKMPRARLRKRREKH